MRFRRLCLCPVTVDLPFCQWILFVRRVLPPKFARFIDVITAEQG
jgi:hypothetical protein